MFLLESTVILLSDCNAMPSLPNILTSLAPAFIPILPEDNIVLGTLPQLSCFQEFIFSVLAAALVDVLGLNSICCPLVNVIIESSLLKYYVL